MDSKHRLHPVHTGRTESDAVAVAQPSERACSSCLEPLSQLEKPAFHCDPCDYTVCQSCHRPKSHPVHPNHDVYYITPISPWRCEVCKRDSASIQEIQCYRCEQCNFQMCKRCYGGVNSLLHHHTLYRTDVRFVYHQSSGEWSCDICRNNNGPGHYYPAHCSSCQFDLCDNCIKPYRSTYHPGHVLYKADSNVTYPRFNGGWRCDRCSQSFIPQVNNVPFHCSQCEFDLCDSCMRTTGEVSNSVGFDVPRPRNKVGFDDIIGLRAGLSASQGISGSRSRAPLTDRGNPITSPSEEVDVHVGRSGPPDAAGDCVICLERPKDATIVHGNTGHVCCCTVCAQELHRTGARCPICRAPIDCVIKQYTV